MNHGAYARHIKSGALWISQIPEGWGIVRFKHLLTEPMKYGANESAEIYDRDLPRYIRITDITEYGELREDTFKSLPYVQYFFINN